MAPDRYLTIEEVRRMWDYVKREGDIARRNGTSRGLTNEMIVELLLMTGIRSEELLHLRIRDTSVFHKKDVIYVHKERASGQRSRVVPVCPDLGKKLQEYIKKVRRGAKPGSPLFVSEGGYRLLKTRVMRNGEWIVKQDRTARMTYQTLYRKIKRIARGAGIPNLRPHALRHTLGTLLYSTEKDICVVGRVLGHVSLYSTQGYIGTCDDTVGRQIKKYRELLADSANKLQP